VEGIAAKQVGMTNYDTAATAFNALTYEYDEQF
jgi:hypothetical protein